jgi:hypothetical protein
LRARRRRKNAKAVVREVITELARLRQVHEQLDRIADIADQLRFDAFSIASSRVPNRHKASHGKISHARAAHASVQQWRGRRAPLCG